MSDEMIGTETLFILADLRQVFKEQGSALRRTPDVTRAIDVMDVLSLKSGIELAYSVDAYYTDGSIYSWCLEITSKGGVWCSDAEVRRSFEGGQETVEALTSISSSDCDDLLRQALAQSKQLVKIIPIG